MHLSAVPTRFRPPKPGQAFTFEIELNRDGKKRAANIGVPEPRRARARARHEAPAKWSLASASAIPAFAVLYLAVASQHRVSPWFALAYLALSAVCFLAYAVDKSAARSGRWRSSEQSLLMLGLLGGRPMRALQYFATLRPGKAVLWCYLVWYLVNAIALFDPTPQIWMNSVGLSAIIGFALLLNVSGKADNRNAPDAWQIFRLFLMPFAVSSFSTLIKGKGYVFIFPSDPKLLLTSVGACGAFLALVAVGKLSLRERSRAG